MMMWLSFQAFFVRLPEMTTSCVLDAQKLSRVPEVVRGLGWVGLGWVGLGWVGLVGWGGGEEGRGKWLRLS